jgi:hypothetical protein
MFLSAIVLYSWAVLSFRYFPTLDGPMLMYYADAFQSLMRGVPIFHSYFTLEKTFGAHLFYFYFVTALSPIFGPVMIEKVFVVAYLIWMAFSFYYFANSVAPGRAFPVALFVFPFVLNSSVYWAFYDFAIGLATGLFLCGWWLRYFDRLNAKRSVFAAAVFIAVIFMHVVDAAIVLLFAGIHFCLYAWITRPAPDLPRGAQLRALLTRNLKPLLHLAGGSAILYLFKPASVGKALTTYFFEEPWERIYQIAVMRPFGPYESRYHRLLLGIVMLAAVLMFVAALWKRRRALVGRAEWEASLLTGLLCLAAFVVVPFWIAGGAYFPHRFAMFGCFFLLAPAAILRMSRRAELAVSAGALAVAVAAIVFQLHMGDMLINRYKAVLELPPASSAKLAAVVEDDQIADPQINYQVQLWAGAHYVRRSGAALLNSPWLDVPGNWFEVSENQPCQFLHPILMRGCLAKAASGENAPPLDLLVGVRARRFIGPMPPDIAGSVAAKYGLSKVWSSDFVAIYAKPNVAAQMASVKRTMP